MEDIGPLLEDVALGEMMWHLSWMMAPFDDGMFHLDDGTLHILMMGHLDVTF
jgi:hypothetical protein